VGGRAIDPQLTGLTLDDRPAGGVESRAEQQRCPG